MSLIAALAATEHSTLTVNLGTEETPHPIHVKVKRLTSEEIAMQGTAIMYAGIPPQVLDQIASVVKMGKDATPAQQIAAMKLIPPSAMAKQAATVEAKVCAGVVALSGDGETWERVKITPRGESKPPGILSVLALPTPVRQQIAKAIDAHSGGEGAGEALATFRRGQADDDSAGDSV